MPITQFDEDANKPPTTKQKTLRFIKHVKVRALKVVDKLFIEDPVVATDRGIIVAVLLMSVVMEMSMMISLGWYVLTTSLVVMVYKQGRKPKPRKKKK